MKQYLGDAVYASDELNPGHITLTTGSHLPEYADNIIHLEPSVFQALEDFSAACGKHDRETRAAFIISRIPEDLRDCAEIIYSDQIDVNSLP